MSADEVLVASWPRPRGYSNGRIGSGRPVHVGGQVGWDEFGKFATTELIPQFAKALDNVIAVVVAAGGAVEDIATMTVFVTNIADYRAALKEIGAAWRARMGKHYPAMALVAVTDLVEREAVVEIQATAYVGAS